MRYKKRFKSHIPPWIIVLSKRYIDSERIFNNTRNVIYEMSFISVHLLSSYGYIIGFLDKYFKIKANVIKLA
jgi:hypothetical protein